MLILRNFISPIIVLSIASAACVSAHDSEVSQNIESTIQIHSTKELNDYLNSTPSSPLNRLPKETRQHFVDSLVFTKAGLASFQYSDLISLSATEIYQTLSLFSVEHATPLVSHAPILSDSDREAMSVQTREDYPGYKCSPPATCISQAGAICIAANCSKP